MRDHRHIFAVASLAIAMLLVAAPTVMADSAELAAMKKVYTEEVDRIEEQAKSTIIEASGKYHAYLVREAEESRLAGDLYAVLALKAEQERVDREQSVPGEIEDDAHRIVAAGQRAFNNILKSTNDKKNELINALTSKYIQRLDELTKTLTMAGDLETALAAREEANQMRRREEETAPAPPAAVVTREVECPACRGLGKSGNICRSCSGSGKCSQCDGKGKVKSPLKGSRTMKLCLYCRSSGKCSGCDGVGGSGLQTCTNCNGSAKVTITVKESDTASINGSSDNSTTDNNDSHTDTREPMRRPPSGPDDLDEYQRAIAELTKAYKSQRPKQVDFAAVLADKDSYTGKLLQSIVYLSNGHPRYVHVSATQEEALAKKSVLLLPRHLSIGVKAANMYKKHDAGLKCVIVYGVASSENTTLFSIHPYTNPGI